MALSARTRMEVVCRDQAEAKRLGKAFTCPRCAFEFVLGRSDPNIEVDHVVAVTQGGTDDLDNLRVWCRSCNRSKNCRADANEEREAVARKVRCACGKHFFVGDIEYALNRELVAHGSWPCPACSALPVRERVEKRQKRARAPAESRLPEGFQPARATLKKAGLL
jgi:hypothetical protein